MWKFLILTVLSLALIGCAGHIPVKGGNLTAQQVTEVTSIDELGRPVVTKETTSASVQQPEDPGTPAGLTISKKNGQTIITGSSSAAQNNAVDLAEIDLLQLPMWIGCLMIPAGLIFGLVTKNWYWGGAIIGTGALMAIGTYLLTQYAMYFFLGIIILIAAAGYLLYKYFVRNRALHETVKLVDAAKAVGGVNKDVLKRISEDTTIQSEKTKEIVDEIRA